MPSPIIASHRLEFTVSGGTRPHKVRYFCDAVSSSDPDGFDFLIKGGGSVGMSAAITSLLAKLSPVWKTTQSIGNFILYQHLSGAYVPVAYDAASSPGSDTNPILVAAQLTLVMRGTSPRELIKHIILESPETYYVGRFTDYTLLPTAIKNYTADLLNTSAGHAGSWVRSRSGNFVSSFLAGTYCANKRIRRDAGVE